MFDEVLDLLIEAYSYLRLEDRNEHARDIFSAGRVEMGHFV